MPEPEKRFTVYINCEGPEFQDQLFAHAVMGALGQVSGGIATGRFSGPIMLEGKTIGNWATQWRNADPENRKPPRPAPSRPVRGR